MNYRYRIPRVISSGDGLVKDGGIDGIRGMVGEYRKELDEVRDRLKVLDEKEKRLKEELETVRSNLEYYTALVADMKKSMNHGENWSMFNDI